MPVVNDVVVLHTIYDHPSDYPDHFVIRDHFIIEGRSVTAFQCRTFDTLEAARRSIPAGCHNLGRHEGDDPVIVETWI